MTGVHVRMGALWVAALILIGGFAGAARGDVVQRTSASTSATAATISLPGVSVEAGSGRLLAVGVATTEGQQVTGVTYGGNALTQRAARNSGESGQTAGARAELWTLSEPAVGSATVTVTFARSASAVVGVATYDGVDALNPVMGPAEGSAGDQATNSASLVLNNTAADADFGVLAVGNTANLTATPTLGPSTDTVTATSLWSRTEASRIFGAGATRKGNTGANQAPNAGINYHWNYDDPQAHQPYVMLMAGLNRGASAIAPTVTTGSATAITQTGATLHGTVTSDGGGAITMRGFVVCAAPCTPVGGAGSTQEIHAADVGTGDYSAAATGLDPDKSYDVRAFATNSAGTAYGSDATFRTLTANHAPVADAGGPYSIDEGGSVSLTAAGSSDQDGDSLTYAWDLDGDGQYDDATGATPTVTPMQADAFGWDDGPASHRIGVRASDGRATATDTATVAVVNVAPDGTVGNDGPVGEGSDATVSVTGVTDPSSADTTAGFHYAYDIGDDGSWESGDGRTYAGGTTAASIAVPTDDESDTAVRVKIFDKDGGVTEHVTHVIADGVAPTVAAMTNDGPIDEGGTLTVTMDGATDPSSADTAAGFHYAYDTDGDGRYDVGDGTYAGSPGAATLRIPTNDSGSWLVRGLIIDKNGLSTLWATRVTVNNVAPTAAVAAPSSTPVDSDLLFTVSATDVSSEDEAGSFTYNIDWGDGGARLRQNGGRSMLALHRYRTAGTYTVTVTATDKDNGLSAPVTTTVTIAAPAPPPPAGPDTSTPAPPAPPAATPVVVGAQSVPVFARVQSLTVSPRCVAAAAATSRAVRIRYRLSTAAAVRVTLQRSIGSRAVAKCPPLHGSQQSDGRLKPGSYAPVSVKQTTGSANGTSLTIAKGSKHGPVGSVATVRPQAMIAKGGKLAPGTYLLTVTTLSADGRVQDTARVKFWVLKARHV
jgi:PKD domain